MRAASVTRASLLIVTLCGACGDDGAATTTGSTGSTGDAGTGTTSTTGMPTSTPGETTTGVPTTGDSGTTAALTGSESSVTITGAASTGGDTSTSGDTSTGGTGTTGVDTTGEAGSTSTGDESTSTGDESTSTGDESSTGDTDTGGDAAIYGYLGMSGSNTLVRFDTESAMTLPPAKSLLPHASYPYDMKIKPDGSEVWVVGASGNGVKIADVATGQITHDIDLTGIGKYAVDVVKLKIPILGAMVSLTPALIGIVIRPDPDHP